MKAEKRKEVCAEIIELAREISHLSDRKINGLGEEAARRMHDDTLTARNMLRSATKPLRPEDRTND